MEEPVRYIQQACLTESTLSNTDKPAKICSIAGIVERIAKHNVEKGIHVTGI